MSTLKIHLEKSKTFITNYRVDIRIPEIATTLSVGSVLSDSGGSLRI